MRRKNGPDSVGLSEETKRNIYFYHHSIEDHIARLAEQAGDKNLVAPITAELVRLLEAKTLWESFRDSQSLPEMRTQRNGNRAGGWAGTPHGPLAADVFSPASGHRPLRKRITAKGRKHIIEAQRKRWAKFHDQQKKTAGWSPERRAEYSKRMKKTWAADPKLRRKMSHTGRTMSPEARAKISAARKAYWKARKAGE